ncbi:TetR/AcrR family transcriptional regulator [Streptomyces sp.]|uniref:TetR/AcrR family transcriptional regulator n=1 Tax=Streptomyces sp. TaxID=1931 RepID=UPI002F401360
MRKTADERRADVVRAALKEFSRFGLYGTSTDAIARAVGVSQPYLFRLYPTKRDIFIAAGHHCFQRTCEAFRDAAHGLDGQEALDAMRLAYLQFAEDRELLLMQMQLYVAANSDEEIRREVLQWWHELWSLLGRLTGIRDSVITEFMSCGMLMNVLVALDACDGSLGWDMLVAVQEHTTSTAVLHASTTGAAQAAPPDRASVPTQRVWPPDGGTFQGLPAGTAAVCTRPA